LTSDAARGTGITRICHHRCFFGGEAIDWLNKYGAERHLFVSEALRRELSLSSSLLAQAPGAVVYDGLPLCSIPDHESRENAKRALGLPVEKAIMLFAGQIIERKGVADILHAWQMLHPTWHRFAELVIVGEDLEKQGAYRRAMEALANQLGCNPRFMGFQRNVPTWLTAADIVLVPSHAEPLGNAVLEAMAHSRPVISSNAGGLPEMTQDRETGILVPIASPRALAAAIESLLSDSVWREQLGQAARKRCEQFFSIDAHVSEILKQYKIGRAVLAVQS
jgi:glycosyltransferase involved in cell wall biosynthesis